jgi:hypothetical protein
MPPLSPTLSPTPTHSSPSACPTRASCPPARACVASSPTAHGYGAGRVGHLQLYDTTGKLAVAATLETVTVWNLRKRTQVTWSTLAPLHGTRIASTFSVVVTTATLQAKRIDVESTCGETIVPRRVPPPCADVGCRQDECYGHGSQCCDRAPCSRVRPVGQTIGRTFIESWTLAPPSNQTGICVLTTIGPFGMASQLRRWQCKRRLHRRRVYPAAPP